ncbi:sigma-54 interaction domain-containing protein [Halomonas sp. NCCP-2165]|nr:sigma-54 dependent transcriptional regulator [Halomonas sp. NCCP-2165]GKW48761.1 sigma-54 dependent regulatory protein [Halomonas sp. NCCP-2165]
MESLARVLLLGESCDYQEVIHELKEKGWAIEPVKEGHGVGAEESGSSLRVGLVILDRCTMEALKRMEALMLKSQHPWVGLLTEEALEAAGVRRLLLDLCQGFLCHPVDPPCLELLLHNALAVARLQQQESEYQVRSEAESGEYEMVGTTPVMWQLFKTIRKVAAVEATVFIHGESGTGKELTAQAIHERSVRAPGPFHAVNCGALPDNLIQSELFGHEKGAFTGAAQRKVGRIEAADGGTLFLDEIGDLPLELQVNLLRFLETRRIQRVGGLDEIAVDVRILAATHVDLSQAVREGRFREDLYHRLNVLQIEVPALREHPEDIEILARFFFQRFSHEKPICLKGFSKEALAVMRQYHWPGNVRELINRVRRAMVMCENRLIQPEDLGIERRRILRHVMTLEEARERAEKQALIAALGRNKARINSAASELGVSRVTIYRLMEKHGVCRESLA